jgi:hypothetical protein
MHYYRTYFPQLRSGLAFCAAASEVGVGAASVGRLNPSVRGRTELGPPGFCADLRRAQRRLIAAAHNSSTADFWDELVERKCVSNDCTNIPLESRVAGTVGATKGKKTVSMDDIDRL